MEIFLLITTRLRYVCNLILGEDELLCNRVSCPQRCKCRGFSIDCTNRQVNSIPTSRVNNSVRILHMSWNDIQPLTLRHFRTYRSLVMLYMINCSLSVIPEDTFIVSTILRHLDLSYNSIHTLHKNVFRSVYQLQTVILRHNHMQTIEHLFSLQPNSHLYHLVHIDISHCDIRFLPKRAFGACPMLRHINLSANNVIELPADIFSQSQNYFYIDLVGNKLTLLHSTNIYSISHIRVIDGEIPELCCFSKSIDDCRVRKTTISSCEHLISNIILQSFIWVNGMTVTCLNAAILYYRFSTMSQHKKWSVFTNAFILNMTVADLLMGIYVLSLAIVSVSYRGRYASVSRTWRGSIACKVLAVLSTISSEVSLLSLVMLTYMQFVTIQHIYGSIRHVKLYVGISLLTAWLCAALVSIVPVLDLPYFGGAFLSKTGTCLLYQLASGHIMGKEYTISIWFAGNLLVLLLMACFQFGLGVKIYKSSLKVAGSRSKKTSHTKTLFVFLVLTAFLCWAPVLTTMLMVNIGVHVSEVTSQYIVILLLPLKSLVNPLLYTVRTMNFKKTS